MRGRSRERVTRKQGRKSARAWDHYSRIGRSKGFQPDRRIDRAVYNLAVPFFFTNFPGDWDYEQMWRTFRGYGRVIDIHVPARTDRYGRRFGFVRYLDVQNVHMLERELDQIKVGGIKIHVNQPRFDRKAKIQRDGSQNNVEKTISFEANRRADMTYADILRGSKKNGLGSTQATTTEQLIQNKDRDRKATHTTKGRKEWIAKSRDSKWRGWEFRAEESDFE
ncbi:hypothetical protein SLEP1_g54881 [Rubroshorea leprosula]|uniref:RRM domain-containing protein n=1 Tax=Rubroshorea leprosula TaxID=152421 RepID=A0AAV5MDY7_9ROSI|nr:hypothetical protein SLEP1_g54881 [Rubroshorea leprosula]